MMFAPFAALLALSYSLAICTSATNLLLTIIIEGAMLTIACNFTPQLMRPTLITSLSLNILTQPVLSAWLQQTLYGRDHLWWQYFIIGEACVILCEAAGYALLFRAYQSPHAISKALLYSFIANGVSLSYGLIS